MAAIEIITRIGSAFFIDRFSFLFLFFAILMTLLTANSAQPLINGTFFIPILDGEKYDDDKSSGIPSMNCLELKSFSGRYFLCLLRTETQSKLNANFAWYRSAQWRCIFKTFQTGMWKGCSLLEVNWFEFCFSATEIIRWCGRSNFHGRRLFGSWALHCYSW